jgi:co-chaperonin GroES (HSP10)
MIEDTDAPKVVGWHPMRDLVLLKVAIEDVSNEIVTPAGLVQKTNQLRTIPGQVEAIGPLVEDSNTTKPEARKILPGRCVCVDERGGTLVVVKNQLRKVYNLNEIIAVIEFDKDPVEYYAKKKDIISE